MKGISRLARWSAIVGTVALVLIASSSLLQHLIRPHERASYFVLLSLVVGVSATFSAMLGACVLELVLSGWSGSSLEALWTGHASTRLDVIATVVMQLPHKYLDYVLSFGLLYVISRYFVTTSLSVAHWLPSWGLQAGCALVLSSLVSYCTHRLEHTIPALWALHKFHHSADRLAILTATRDTKLSGALDLALRALPIAILSVPIAAKPTTASPAYLLVGAYVLLTALLRLNSFLIHSNLDLGYGWIGKLLRRSSAVRRKYAPTNR